MTEHALPAYRDLKSALEKTSLKLNPSQAHGLLCGILCGDMQQNTDWETWLTGAKSTPKTKKTLAILYIATEKQLKEFTFEFQLVLPTDREELSARAEALTLWAQGFLTGLKLMHIPIINREKDEVTEAIDDIIEIAKMNFENVKSTEDDEQAYMELVEYIRVAVILIYHAMHNEQGGKIIQSVDKQLH